MVNGDWQPDPYRAFQRGRLAVDRHVSKMLQAGHMWEEETATDLLLAEASPDVRFWKFTKQQEGAVGADWLWWWIDAVGTSFGLLTQAKVLKRRGTRWHIDFSYRRMMSDRPQINKLIAASTLFNVPAVHILFCGTPAYRASLDCGLSQTCGGKCRDRERAGVSIVPSIIPQYLAPIAGQNLAAEAFHWALPLEDIADPGRPQPPLAFLAHVHPDIAEFMRRPQVGARRVARAMAEAAHQIRIGQLSAAVADEADVAEDAVFPHLPDDRGHFGVPYLAHLLGGLRHRPPVYVEDLVAGRTPPRWLTEAVAGLVVIRDPEPATQQLASVAHDQVTKRRHLTLIHSHDRG